jgi:hypothetical protein
MDTCGGGWDIDNLSDDICPGGTALQTVQSRVNLRNDFGGRSATGAGNSSNFLLLSIIPQFLNSHLSLLPDG